jgi:protein-tyrosine phosphatase
MIAMLLLAAVGTDPDEIVDDYLETVRLGDVRAASVNRKNAEPAMEAFCRDHGTTTEMAFRDAMNGLDLHTLLVEAGINEAEQRALTTWRGTLAPILMS